jgi:hypothetical protein
MLRSISPSPFHPIHLFFRQQAVILNLFLFFIQTRQAWKTELFSEIYFLFHQTSHKKRVEIFSSSYMMKLVQEKIPLAAWSAPMSMRMDGHISRNVADTLRSWYAYPWNRNRENIYRTVINLTLTEHKTTWTNQRKTASKNQLPSLFASFFLTPFSLPLLPCKPNQWEPVNHGHRQTSYPTKAKLPKWGRESPTQGFLFPVYTTKDVFDEKIGGKFGAFGSKYCDFTCHQLIITLVLKKIANLRPLF